MRSSSRVVSLDLGGAAWRWRGRLRAVTRGIVARTARRHGRRGAVVVGVVGHVARWRGRIGRDVVHVGSWSRALAAKVVVVVVSEGGSRRRGAREEKGKDSELRPAVPHRCHTQLSWRCLCVVRLSVEGSCGSATAGEKENRVCLKLIGGLRWAAARKCQKDPVWGSARGGCGRAWMLGNGGLVRESLEEESSGGRASGLGCYVWQALGPYRTEDRVRDPSTIRRPWLMAHGSWRSHGDRPRPPCTCTASETTLSRGAACDSARGISGGTPAQPPRTLRC